MNLALGRLLLADAGSCTDDSGDSTLVRGYDCDDDSDHCTLSVPLCGVHTGVAISPARHSLTQKSKKRQSCERRTDAAAMEHEEEGADVPARVSPSLLGEFFGCGECRRFLALRSGRAAHARWCGADGAALPLTERLLLECGVPCVPGAHRGPSGAPAMAAAGATDADADADPVLAAHAREGIAWEAELLARLRAGTLPAGIPQPCRVIAAPAPDGRLTAEQTLTALAEVPAPGAAPLVLYQATLVPTEPFASSLAIPPCFPDFIFVYPSDSSSESKEEEEEGEEENDQRGRVVVVDAKGSRRVRAGHMVQVALYARLLRDTIAAAGLAHVLRVADEGGVWLRGADDYARFALAPAEQLVQRALTAAAHDAAPAVALTDIPWACGPHCGACPFRTFCERHAAVAASSAGPGVGALVRMRARITADDAALLDTLLERYGSSTPDARLTDCGAAAAFVERVLTEGEDLDSDVRARLEALQPVLCAAHSGKPCATRAGTLALPVRGEDVTVLCALCTEAPTRRLAGFHIAVRLRASAKAVLAIPQVCTFVLRPRTDADSRAVGVSLVAALHTVLAAVHDHNSRVPAAQWRKRLSLTVHTFSARETRLLRSVLVGAACFGNDSNSEEETVQLHAQELLRTLFPACGCTAHTPAPPDLARLTRPSPLCTLEPELARLFALPLRWWETGLGPCARAFGVRAAATTDTGATLDRVLCDAAVCADRPGAPPTLFEDTLSAALATRAVLLGDLMNAVRKALDGSERAGRSVPYAKAFAWLPPITAPTKDKNDDKKEEEELLSKTRQQCYFASAHELVLAARALAALYASKPFEVHLRDGTYLHLVVPQEPDALTDALEQLSISDDSSSNSAQEKEKEDKKPQRGRGQQRHNNRMTLALDGAMPSQGLEGTKYWWLIPDEAPAPAEGRARTQYFAELEACLLAEAEPRKLFSRGVFVLPPRWARVSVEQSPEDSDSSTVTVSSYTRLPAAGTESVAAYFLVPACFDATTPQLLTHLAAAPRVPAHGETPVALEALLDTPSSWARAPFTPAAARTTARAQALLARDASPACRALTASQRAALQHVLAAHVHLLWGPPGTGKTRTLAALVLLLAEATKMCDGDNEKDEKKGDDDAHKQQQKGKQQQRIFRVLMTALSHANTEHFLAAVRRQRDAVGLGPQDLALGRLNPQTHRVTDVDAPSDAREPTLAQFLAAHAAVVVAGTEWQIRGTVGARAAFDLVLWDDASQCRPAELAVPADCLACARSRLVVAGDPLQLPPVSRAGASTAAGATEGADNADELEPVAGWLKPAQAACVAVAPPVAGSLFDCVRARAGDAHVSVLCECWRGNAELCAALREGVYTHDQCPAYAPACDRVADATFLSAGVALDSTAASPIARFALAPSRSLVVVLYRWDGTATRTDACPEAAAVRELCAAVRASPALRHTPAAEFWARHLLVVCPHHFQRAAVLSALAEGFDSAGDEDEDEEEERRAFIEEAAARGVETVERAQGQERDVVVVDYALFSTRRVRDETAFVYDAHRLNVAVSRARTRCVLLLSEHVLAAWAPAALLRSPAAARGLALLHTFVAFARSRGNLLFVDAP